jgi:tripartite-type tricarboxylate transporter receptor subunit TctC
MYKSVALIVMSFLAPALALAQGATYPNRSVRVIVAISPGGTPDILARLLSANLSQRIGPVVSQRFSEENALDWRYGRF